MLPEITKKDVKNIVFPVYKLDTDDIKFYKGVLYCGTKIIDDRNQAGRTIGVRRAQVKEDLYPLNYMAIDYIMMIQAKYKHFIDTEGKAFTYIKTKFYTVKCHKIEKITPLYSYSLVKVKGVSKQFTVIRPPPDGAVWACIIYIKNEPWAILEYAYEKLAPYKRKL